MEQTLGKRIAENRKRLSMTQDALAEKLGITAQAVSKWENDQSCPDITMLPKLAEIFGISTDELLGCPAKEQVHQAEVVDADDDDHEPEGVHFQNGNWEFHWDTGRRNALSYATFVLLVGGLMLADALLQWPASFWDLLWPSFLLVYGIFGLTHRFSFFKLGSLLFGGYFLIQNIGLWELDIAGDLIFPAVVVLFGISLLVDALRKPGKPRFSVTRKGGNSSKTKWDCQNSDDSFQCSLSFGENTHFADMPVLAGGEANVSFGELTVDLSGCEEVREDCTVSANCSFGELRLLVPRRFAVQSRNSTAFAAVTFSGQPDPSPAGVIHLDANVSFGEISVCYV